MNARDNSISNVQNKAGFGKKSSGNVQSILPTFISLLLEKARNKEQRRLEPLTIVFFFQVKCFVIISDSWQRQTK